MKVLVTGAAGFIGSRLVEVLTTRGDGVVGYDNMSRGLYSARVLSEVGDKMEFVVGDILDFPKLKEVVMGGNFEVIYHLAALPSHRLAMERPREYAMIDLAGTANVLEAARLCKRKPLVVFASSNKVYGKQPCPWREDKLPQPEGPYAVAKWASEKMCEMYNKYFDVPCVILRYHHVAGKRSNPELALSVFTGRALRGLPLEVHGHYEKGKFTSCSADYTHIDDAVLATLLAVEKYRGFRIYNIANKKLVTVEWMAEKVVTKLRSNSEIKRVELWPHETLKHHSDVSLAERELGFVAEIPIEKAIDDYLEWYVSKPQLRSSAQIF